MAEQTRVGRVSAIDSAGDLASSQSEISTLRQRLLNAQVNRPMVTPVDVGSSSDAVRGLQSA